MDNRAEECYFIGGKGELGGVGAGETVRNKTSIGGNRELEVWWLPIG